MNIYIGYTLLGQIMWGLLPLFWMLLQDISAFYILATRIVWSALFCYGLIVQKKLLPNGRSFLTCVRGFEPPTFWSVAKRSIQLS